MAFDGLLVSEIFHSLQGETSLAGERFAFVRLTGCNLRCTYCDSAYAFKGGSRMNIASVLEAIATYNVRHVLITGGEPLIQRQTPALVDALLKNHYLVSIETHGEIPIESVAGKARIVMDIKTPSSGMSREGFVRNLPLLRDGDEVKFVIASKQDYAWAKTLILSGQIPKNCLILLSPAIPAEMSPGNIQPVEIQWLANQLLEDRLPARLQIQLHKYIWGANRRGV